MLRKPQVDRTRVVIWSCFAALVLAIWVVLAVIVFSLA